MFYVVKFFFQKKKGKSREIKVEKEYWILTEEGPIFAKKSIMAVLTFEKIKVQELDERLINTIKAFFKNGDVRISVVVEKESNTEAETLEAVLQKNRNAPYVVRFDEHFDLNALAKKIEQDENFDLSVVLEAHKIPNPNVAS